MAIAQCGRVAAAEVDSAHLRYDHTLTCRWFVSGSGVHHNVEKQRHSCPFVTLGIPRSSSYATVKARFIKLAMKLHPDIVEKQKKEATLNNNTTRTADKFIAVRTAFEAIVESDDGTAVLREGYEYAEAAESKKTGLREEEFEAWFHEETGHRVPYNYDDMSTRHIDPAILREVAAVTEGMSQGGLDKGGMWQYARELQEKAKKGDMPSLRVSDGGSSSSTSKGRRRRRRSVR